MFFPLFHTPFVSCTLIAKSCCCALSDSFLTELDLGVQGLEHLNHLTAQLLFTQLAQYLWQDWPLWFTGSVPASHGKLCFSRLMSWSYWSLHRKLLKAKESLISGMWENTVCLYSLSTAKPSDFWLKWLLFTFIIFSIIIPVKTLNLQQKKWFGVLFLKTIIILVVEQLFFFLKKKDMKCWHVGIWCSIVSNSDAILYIYVCVCVCIYAICFKLQQ